MTLHLQGIGQLRSRDSVISHYHFGQDSPFSCTDILSFVIECISREEDRRILQRRTIKVLIVRVLASSALGKQRITL